MQRRFVVFGAQRYETQVCDESCCEQRKEATRDGGAHRPKLGMSARGTLKGADAKEEKISSTSVRGVLLLVERPTQRTKFSNMKEKREIVADFE